MEKLTILKLTSKCIFNRIKCIYIFLNQFMMYSLVWPIWYDLVKFLPFRLSRFLHPSLDILQSLKENWTLKSMKVIWLKMSHEYLTSIAFNWKNLLFVFPKAFLLIKEKLIKSFPWLSEIMNKRSSIYNIICVFSFLLIAFTDLLNSTDFQEYFP